MNQNKCYICNNWIVSGKACTISLSSPSSANSSSKICESCKRKLDMLVGVKATDFKMSTKCDNFIPVNFMSSKEMRAEKKRRSSNP